MAASPALIGWQGQYRGFTGASRRSAVMKSFYARSLHWLSMLGFTLLGASLALTAGALMH